MEASKPFDLSPVLKHLRIRNQIAREFLAEFLGTFVLILFGDGVVAQVVLSEQLNPDDPKGSFFTINWAWGVAVTLGVLVAGGVSGAHINPAVTTSLVLVGKFPWKKMFHYILGQYLGAFIGAAFVYLTYFEAFQEAHDDLGGATQVTAGIFATYPADHLSTGGGFLDQTVGTGLLLLCILAISDPKNMKINTLLSPLYIGFIVLNIGLAFGFNCGYAINPARDLAPRVFTAMAGWGSDVFTWGNNWAWVPVVACHVGGAVGAWIYVLCVENHWPSEDELEQQAKLKEQPNVADQDAEMEGDQNNVDKQ